MTAETNNLTREEARARAAVISNVSYEVALDFTRGAENFGCEATIRFKAAGEEAFLDYTAPGVHSITLNGAELPAEAFDGNRIRLKGLTEDNEVRIVSDSAYTRTGVGINRFVDPVDSRVYVHSDLEPFDAHRIYPCFDQPDIKGTFEFTVTAPEGWVVISNMTALERPEDGRAGVWRFGITPKMSTYITAVVGGPYRSITDEHRGIRLGLWCRESLAAYVEADAEEIFTITKQGLDFFEETFDYPYPFGGKYDQLFVADFNPGAMENSGAVTFNERYVFRSKVTDTARESRAETILHEMAHMWFGNLVTMRWWDDLWLNESFATYASVVAAVAATRFKGAWTRFSTGWKGWAYRQDQQPTTHPVVADIPDINATKVNFDAISYAKGASVLRQLVAWVGPEEFDQGIRNYFKRHEFQNTNLEDFLGALEETSGRDLRSWSTEWLETAGVNTLRPEFELKDGKFTSFTIVQTAPEEHPTLRSHRLGLGLYREDGGKLRRRLMLELDVEGERTEVPKLVGEEFPDLLLLNDGDLAYAKIVLDEGSLSTVTNRLRDVDDSLARAVMWSAAWEMVRDAGMRARDFVALVLGNIGAEQEVNLVQNILGHAQVAITTFAHHTMRPDLRKALADAAYQRLNEEEPGSDLQLSWGNTFIDLARDQVHLDVLRGLLDGEVEVEGFPVDVDRRWTIVTSLVARGAASEDLISEELERDPTDDGRRRAATARTARPDIDAKEEAFSAITGDEELSLAMMRALIVGFQDPDHPELLEPFVDRYFEAVPRLWEEREYDVAATFVRGMAPRVIFEDWVTSKIDQFLQQERPFPIRRPLLETKADLERAIKAQAFDAS